MGGVLRKIATWVFVVGLGGMFISVFGEWLIEVARDKGWYNNAGTTWDRALTVIREFATSNTVLIPLLILGGVVLGLWLDTLLRRLDGIIVPGDKPSPVALKDRVFVPPEMTARKMLEFYYENTAIQAAELTKHLIGKWFRISGRLGDVLPASQFSGTSHVSFETNRDTPIDQRDWFYHSVISMYFPASHVERLRGLKRSDPISVVGRISEIESYRLVLDQCELVDDQPEPVASTSEPLSPPPPAKPARRRRQKTLPS